MLRWASSPGTLLPGKPSQTPASLPAPQHPIFVRKHSQLTCACYACQCGVLVRVKREAWEQQVGLLVPNLTPLHAAAKRGNLEAAQLLVEAGHSPQVGEQCWAQGQALRPRTRCSATHGVSLAGGRQ
jgi:hypothetical protein